MAVVAPYTTATVLATRDQGTTVEYLKDGVVVRSVQTMAGKAFFFDSSFYLAGFKLTDIHFGSAAPQGVALGYDAGGNHVFLAAGLGQAPAGDGQGRRTAGSHPPVDRTGPPVRFGGLDG